MKTLKITLKQHTPLIHFQHDHEGATLRASEVKPKLDRYILNLLGDGDCKKGADKAKDNHWLVGKGEHPALNYKMRIVSKEKNRDVHLNSRKDSTGKWVADEFPLLLANIGGKANKDELINLVMYESNILYLSCRDIELYEKLEEQIPSFVENTNFGQRSNKGFGSFTVRSIEKDDGTVSRISNNYIEDNTIFMDFVLHRGTDVSEHVYVLNIQKRLFGVIERFWKDVRGYVNKDSFVKHLTKDSVQSYIKGMKYFKLDQNNINRIPAPIMFKPITYIDEDENGNGKLSCIIYIMPDADFVQRLKNKNSIRANTNNISNLTYVDKFINDQLLKGEYENWLVNIKGERIQIEFCKEETD